MNKGYFEPNLDPLGPHGGRKRPKTWPTRAASVTWIDSRAKSVKYELIPNEKRIPIHDHLGPHEGRKWPKLGLSLHSYSLRFAMAACRAADANPDLPRLDYISCKKRKKHCNRCSQWAVHK